MRWLDVAIRVGIITVAQTTVQSLTQLVSWNLLAQDFARVEKYPSCDPKHLEWPHRKSLILRRLLSMDADLICLQEVQVNLWPEISDALNVDYHGVLQNVTRGHNVANAILVRKSSPLKLKRVESRSRALLAVLRDDSTGNHLYLGNLHLEAGPTELCSIKRYNQMKSLFKRLRHQCTLDHLDVHDVAIVLAGDFNILRENSLHAQLTEGLLYHPDQLHTKPPIETVPLRDAYMLRTDDSKPIALGPVQSKVCYENKKDHAPEWNCLSRTYCRGWVLDYIFTSGQVLVDETQLFHRCATTDDSQNWPSQTIPSDHIPIGALLSW